MAACLAGCKFVTKDGMIVDIDHAAGCPNK